MTPYGAELSAAWAQHLAPREPGAPTVISTFAGCGGSSLGYSMAGFRELLAVEWNDHAAAMFRLNFPGIPVHEGDIADVDPASIALPPGGLDVLDGSPPCQGFSTNHAHRKITDSRNQLFREYVRLLDAWRPRMFVMENVSGMVKGKMRLVFAEALRALRTAGPGYRVKVQLLDASWFRVPQTRQRLIFLGIRSDLGAEPEHPRALSGQLTVRDAWADLDGTGEIVEIPANAHSKRRLMRYITPGKRGADALLTAGRWPGFYNIGRLAWHLPSRTISATFVAAGSSLLHPDGDRHIGTRELTRLQSFPDEYDWGGSDYTRVHARVGNSVPPLLMRAIAQSVRAQLGRIDEGEGRRHGQVRSAS